MKLGLINSAWAQAGRDTAWGIRKTKEIGFDTIDIFADPLDLDVRQRRLIARECEKLDLPIVSLCAVAFGLADFNPSVQRFAVDRVKAYLDLAYEYDADNVLLVLGEYIWQQEVIPPAEQWKIAVENVRRLAEHAGIMGRRIAIEIEPFQASLIRDVDTMVRFLEDVDADPVKANIDVSHLALAGVEPDQLARLAGQAIHVHLSDCDGVRHGDLPPGRGVVDFSPYLKAIADLNFEGSISIELEYAPDPSQIEAWVRESFQTSAILMREAGLRA